MGKINIKLASGIEDNKGVITAFKAVDDVYVVLDNESTGSMGLPIILVCKLIENKIEKITDQTEWQKVKEYLKNIIGGNKVEYVNIATDLIADDIYYTQLTLPIVSFDALKNNYKPEGETIGATPQLSQIVAETPVPSVEPVIPVAPIPSVEPVIPVAPMPSVEPVIPVTPMPSVEPVIPVTPMPSVEPVIPVTPMPSVEPVIPVTPMPSIEPVVNEPTPIPSIPPVPEIVTTTMPEMVTSVEENNYNVEAPQIAPAMPVEQVMPEPMVTPVINEGMIPPVTEEVKMVSVNYEEMKETFMKACENVFDALVNKLENKE